MQQGQNPRQFSVWSALFLAPLFSGNLYRDVARNWRGIALRLILLVLLITWIVDGVLGNRGLKNFATNEFPKVIEDFPQITIKDGVVSSPVEQPYYMKEKETGKTFMILDTTGTVTSLDDEPDAILLLTENKLHYRGHNQPGQMKIQDLSQVKNFYIDRPIAQNWMDWIAKWAMWVLIPLALVFSFIYRLIEALIYGAIGMIWNNAFNARLSYAALMRLAFVAMTPAILFDTALSLTHAHVPAQFLIDGAIAMIYLAVAVKANEQAPAPPQPMYGGYGGPAFIPQQQPYPQQQPMQYPQQPPVQYPYQPPTNPT